MISFGPMIIAMINILTNHTMLKRKRSIFSCIVAFIVNTFIFIIISTYLENIIINPFIYKYLLYLTVFSYIGYICFVFIDSFSIKLFSMFSIWVFSIIGILISNIIYDLFGDYCLNTNVIFAITIIIHLILLLNAYLWYGNYFKKILSKINISIIFLMSAYMFIALLLLINSHSLNIEVLENINPIIEMSLLIIFIILGYFIVFFGISSSSKSTLLKQNIDILIKQSDFNYKLANYDALTGIANRQNTLNHISKVLDDYKNINNKYVLFMFDIDKFKLINDVYGHVVGDKALKFVVNRVKNCLREDDIIGRLGGDEFIIFPKSIQTRKDAESLINRITDTLVRPLKIDEELISIDISIGVSIFPTDARLMDDLIEQADKAMYRAKKRIGTSYEFFNDL